MAPRTSSAAAVPGTPSRRTSSRVSLPPAPPTPRSSKPTPTKPKPTPSKKAKISAPIPEDQEMKDAPAAVDGLKRKRSSVGRPRGSVASSMGGGGLQRKKVFKAGLNVVPMPPLATAPARSLFIFGTGDMGAFGLGTDELGEINRPRLHKWFEAGIAEGKFGAVGKGIEEASAGGMHTLVVDAEGKVWSWGVNDNASLGRITNNVPDPENEGATIDADVLETEPMVVSGLVEEEFRAVRVAAGDSISIALGELGDVRAWGSFRSSEGLLGFNGVAGASKTQFSPIPLPSISHLRFSQVVCGSDHVVALTTDGTVYVWGNGQQNQLGRRIIERRKINGLAPERLALRNIVAIGAGLYHSFAVNKDGQVFAWGLNSLRQTGVSDAKGGWEEIIQVPTLVDALDPSNHGGAKVIKVDGGEHHSLFLFDNGEVWGCGRCDGAQLGLGAEHPARKELKERVDEEIEKKRLERVESGVEDDPMAPPPAVDEFIPEPVQIFFPPAPTAANPAPDFNPYPSSAEEYTAHPMVSISAGTRHNLAVSKEGNVYSWGYGNQCQLGLGPDVETAEVPARVRSKGLNDFNVIDASAGGLHCVLVAVRKPTDA